MVPVGRGGKQVGKGREERLLTTTGVNEPTRKKICGQKKKPPLIMVQRRITFKNLTIFYLLKILTLCEISIFLRVLSCWKTVFSTK